jgi:hypothetical protein
MKFSNNKTFTPIINLLLSFTLVANLASCGTILYPERKGQRPGKIDPTVAVLDGVGLLFFIIPGVIAFAVDFNNNSIYLPHSSSSRKHSSKHHFSQLHLQQKLNMQRIEKVVRAKTGIDISTAMSQAQVTRLGSSDELDSQFALYASQYHLASAVGYQH